jgi:transcriptional regulator with XRE-family HTH domain
MESSLTVPLSVIVSDSLAREHISLRELAEATGIAATTLHRRLHGHAAFTFTELEGIARVLDTTVTELVAQAERSAA